MKERLDDLIYTLKEMWAFAKLNKPLTLRLVVAAVVAIVLELVTWISLVNYLFVITPTHAARVSGPAWLEMVIFFGSFILIAVVGDLLAIGLTTKFYERKHEIKYPDDELTEE